MNTFYKDLQVLDEKMSDVANASAIEILNTGNEVAILPYFLSKDQKIGLVLTRRMELGTLKAKNHLFNLAALRTPITDSIESIEDVMSAVGLSNWNVKDTASVGSVMTDPVKNTHTIDLLLIECEEGDYLDKGNGVIAQKENEFEIGSVDFEQVLGAIKEERMFDATTRMLFAELYIMLITQQEEPQEQNQQSSKIGQNNTVGFQGGISDEIQSEQDNTTGMVTDEYIAQNSQTDFGKIYSLK